MNSATKLNIENYVSRKIAPHSVIAVRDMLLYLQLIKYSKYRKLASLTDSIYEVPGMDNVSECVQRLDNKLARRYFYLKKLSVLNRIHKLFKSKEDGPFKATRKEQRAYLFSVLKDKTLERIHTIASIHKLKLVTTYPEILSAILKKRAETKTRNQKDLELNEILELTTSMLQKKLVYTSRTPSCEL